MGFGMKGLTIYCPKCGRQIFNANDFGSSFLERKCEKCKKLVSYDSDTGRVVMRDVPSRNTSSGMRFY